MCQNSITDVVSVLISSEFMKTSEKKGSTKQHRRNLNISLFSEGFLTPWDALCVDYRSILPAD